MGVDKLPEGTLWCHSPPTRTVGHFRARRSWNFSDVLKHENLKFIVRIAAEDILTHEDPFAAVSKRVMKPRPTDGGTEHYLFHRIDVETTGSPAARYSRTLVGLV